MWELSPRVLCLVSSVSVRSTTSLCLQRGDFSFEVTVMNVPAALREQWLRYTVDTGRRLLSL